ncbi:hypothetical protein ScPMuIL_009814 [Solemya velum]
MKKSVRLSKKRKKEESSTGGENSQKGSMNHTGKQGIVGKILARKLTYTHNSDSDDGSEMDTLEFSKEKKKHLKKIKMSPKLEKSNAVVEDECEDNVNEFHKDVTVSESSVKMKNKKKKKTPTHREEVNGATDSMSELKNGLKSSSVSDKEVAPKTLKRKSDAEFCDTPKKKKKSKNHIDKEGGMKCGVNSEENVPVDGTIKLKKKKNMKDINEKSGKMDSEDKVPMNGTPVAMNGTPVKLKKKKNMKDIDEKSGKMDSEEKVPMNGAPVKLKKKNKKKKKSSSKKNKYKYLDVLRSMYKGDLFLSGNPEEMKKLAACEDETVSVETAKCSPVTIERDESGVFSNEEQDVTTKKKLSPKKRINESITDSQEEPGEKNMKSSVSPSKSTSESLKKSSKKSVKPTKQKSDTITPGEKNKLKSTDSSSKLTFKSLKKHSPKSVKLAEPCEFIQKSDTMITGKKTKLKSKDSSSKSTSQHLKKDPPRSVKLAEPCELPQKSDTMITGKKTKLKSTDSSSKLTSESSDKHSKSVKLTKQSDSPQKSDPIIPVEKSKMISTDSPSKSTFGCLKKETQKSLKLTEQSCSPAKSNTTSVKGIRQDTSSTHRKSLNAKILEEILSKTSMKNKPSSEREEEILSKTSMKNKPSSEKESNDKNKTDLRKIKKTKFKEEELPNSDGRKETNKKEKKQLTLKERMTEQLNAARFRYLNEQLYTQTGKESLQLFRNDVAAFKVYHQGYQTQVDRWPSNPVDIIINEIKTGPSSLVVADFGCGDAKLARSIPCKVHSFDLVALNKHVTVCDMAKVPLQNKSVDIAVFCLSLMGTNLVDFLTEANRILKNGGILKIAEVISRIQKLSNFVKQVECFGFKVTKQDPSNKMFVMLDFKKIGQVKTKSIPEITLDPCVYKKR